MKTDDEEIELIFIHFLTRFPKRILAERTEDVHTTANAGFLTKDEILIKLFTFDNQKIVFDRVKFLLYILSI